MLELLIIFGGKYLIALSVAGFAAYFFFISPQERRELGILALFSLPLAYLLARVAGFVYSHPQPFVEWGAEPLIAHEIDNAFPSDHTLVAAAFAILASLYDKYWGAALMAAAALIALARMAAGLHALVDIIASFVLAGFAVALVAAIARVRGWRP
jgi:undecaprenyl-diphosphatase